MQRFATVSAGLALVLVANAALAAGVSPYTRGFDAVPTKETPTDQSGIALDGALLPEAKTLHGVFLLDFNDGILALKLGEQKLGDLIPWRLDAHVMASYQLLDRLELAVDIPLTIYQQDNFKLLRDQGVPAPAGSGVSAVGLGSVRAMARFGLLNPETAPLGIGVALIGELRLPSFDENSFIADRGPVVAPRIAVERAFGPVRVIANAGYRFHPAAQFLNIYVGQQFTLGAGAIVRLPNISRLTDVDAIGELHAATPTEAPFNFNQADSLKTPLELLVGLRARFFNQWSGELDFGKGLSTQSGYGREAFRILASVRYEMAPPKPKKIVNPDRDGDGIPDSEDACPDQPGPKEFDGCPDRDGDGVPDNVDKCPDQPGPPENEGCPVEEPQVVLEARRIRIKNNVLFETASSTIQKQSFKILDEVYDVLSKHPEIAKVRIEGHTDNRGPRDYNLDLSQRRAKSVVDYLVKKGISKTRMIPRGYGFDKPVASNETPLGRAKNRRVEFNLIQEDDSAPPKALELPQGETQVHQVVPGEPTAAPDAGTPLTPGPAKGPADAGTP